MKPIYFAFALALCGSAPTLLAATPAAPAISKFTPEQPNAAVFHMSDNGKWAVGQGISETGYDCAPFLVDMTTRQFTSLFADADKEEEAGAYDVTDDGTKVAGCWKGDAAIYNTATGKWTKMPVPPGYSYVNGRVASITPDGRYAVGYFWVGMGQEGGYTTYLEEPMAWDLTGSRPVYLDLQNIPNFDTAGDRADSVRFLEISPDGKYILIHVNFTAPMTAWTCLYDINAQQVIPLGTIIENNKVRPGNGEIIAVETGKFSRDSKRIGLTARNNDDEAVIAVYDIDSKEFQVIPESTGKMFGDIDNNGVIYASAPDIPLRNWGFFAQGYWFDWKLALQELWGVNWETDIAKDDFGLSGTFASVSGDGLDLMAVAYQTRPTEVYSIKLSQPLSETASLLDPLSNHTVSPANGSVFSTLRNVNVYFDREIEVIGDRNCVKAVDAQGNEVYQSMAFSVLTGEPRTLSVTFRNAVLEKDKVYTVVIPAGSLRIKGDSERTNKEIRVSYIGRENAAVKPMRVSPEPGTGMPRLSMSTNPVAVEFDAMLTSLPDGAINLYGHQEGDWELLTSLISDIQGNVLNIYPRGEVRLAKDNLYKITIAPNTVGDLAGNNGNEAFEIQYEGTFEREISTDNGIVYANDFSSGFEDMMLFDGDQRTPQNEPALWGFTYEYPWWYVMDADEGDQAVASHSMYTPAGKSDDWMVTPQLYIPGDDCNLTFQSQSYKFNAQDRLKVYVYATESVYMAPINAATIDKFRQNAVLVYDELQSPGATEDNLKNEWRDNTISLAQFAGKDIYIAFVNDNDDQSAVFIDNIKVERSLDFTLGLDVPSYVVDAENVKVAGKVQILAPQSFSGVSFKLVDAEGNTVDNVSDSAVTLSQGESYNFSFATPLPLAKGTRNRYNVEATVGTVTTTFSGTVTNLDFKPERTLVFEEVTGTKCQFCPLGHRGLDVLESLYGDNIIPVAIHSYSGGSDFLTDWTQAYGQFLGLSAAPLAAVNRQEAGSPFYSDGVYYHYNDPEEAGTWFDIATRMFDIPAEAEITIQKADADPQGNISVEATMRYAFNNDNANLNLFTVVLENGLTGRQVSGIYNNGSEVLGPWGRGGEYGKDKVMYTFNHVARGMHGNNFTGVSGFFPRQITAGTSYKAEYSFPMPDYVADPANTEAVVMLIDANTGKIINAARMPIESDGSAVDTLGEETDTPADVFTLTGLTAMRNALPQDLRNLAPGLYIYKGRKLVIR